MLRRERFAVVPPPVQTQVEQRALRDYDAVLG